VTGDAASGSKAEAHFEAPPSPNASPLPAPGDTKAAKSINRGVPDDYQIGAGDGLSIAVYHEPDATVPTVVVRPDGRISMPLLKEVDVLGLTPSQLEARITEQLKKYLTAPDVTVIVTAINSKKIYLVGAVKKEGPIAFTYRMTVLQALSEAGGLTEYAKRKKIYVLRNQNGREFRLPFDYDGALKGEHMELNVPLMAGDTIVVPH
jgi:polysaccharide export outer membrane protein